MKILAGESLDDFFNMRWLKKCLVKCSFWIIDFLLRNMWSGNSDMLFLRNSSLILLISAFSLLLLGCSKSSGTIGAPSKSRISVNVHGVNYSAEPFRYVVEDAGDPRNRAGGEHVGPFSGGGTVCCFMLPEHWKRGIRVKIFTTHWLSKDVNGNLPEVFKESTVDIPEYPKGEVGDLWVLRATDGSIEAVSSNVEPDHPLWPGKEKGWPKASLSHRKTMWEIQRKIAENNVRLFRDALSELDNTNVEHTQKSWEYDIKYNSEKLLRFSGPDDPAYAKELHKRYEDDLRYSETKLKRILEERP